MYQRMKDCIGHKGVVTAKLDTFAKERLQIWVQLNTVFRYFYAKLFREIFIVRNILPPRNPDDYHLLLFNTFCVIALTHCSKPIKTLLNLTIPGERL